MKVNIETDRAAQATVAPLKYRVDIDGIRAIAVLLVLAFHFALVPAITAGFLGVDVFFVISGFLITSILRKQMDANAFSLRRFYINRIRRLAPALLAVLLMVMSAGALWLFPIELIDLSKQALLSQFYVANIYYWKNINYFGLQVHEIYLLHTWSLAVEEQFYLIYPVCIWLLHRYCKRYFWVAIALCCLVSFALNILFMSHKPEATFYLFPTRAWELLMGALVLLLTYKCARSKYFNELIGLLGAGLILIAVTCYRGDFHIPGYYALLPTVGAACLLFSGQDHATIISKALSWTPVAYIGQISYSLYLVHWPLNIFAGHLIKNYSPEWRVAMFALSIVLAAVVYHAVEDPIRRKHMLVTNNKLMLGYVMGLAATVSLFMVVRLSNGLPNRFPDEVVRLASFVNDKTEPLDKCNFTGQPLKGKNSFCRIGIVGQGPTWLVYGDSHAWAAHGALISGLRSMAKPVCLFLNPRARL